MNDRNFAVFFERFPRSIEDVIYYFRVYAGIVTPAHPVRQIRTYTRNANKFARKAHVGDIYYMVVDWFNKNHFDYRGLIPMGLAIDATGLNIY